MGRIEIFHYDFTYICHLAPDKVDGKENPSFLRGHMRIDRTCRYINTEQVRSAALPSPR